MNTKRKIFTLLLVVCMIVSLFVVNTSVSAGTLRRSRKLKIGQIPDRSGPTDYWYEDFSKVEPGILPSGVSGGKNTYGYFTTEITDIGGGMEKNCFKLVDTDPSNTSTPSSKMPQKNLKGFVGTDIRFKFSPESETSSQWSSFVIEFHSGNGMNSRLVCSSADGILRFNQGGYAGQKDMTTKAPQKDGWYTFTVIFDFDNQNIDVLLLDETTNAVTQVLDENFYTDGEFSSLTDIRFRSSALSGSWYVDYVRVYDAEHGMDYVEVEIPNKGRPAVKVQDPVAKPVKGRTNIMLDGRYKYTTKAPKVENGEVLVTARNIASFFNMKYNVTEDSQIFENDTLKFTVALDGSGIKQGTSQMKLSAPCKAEGNQVFIPIGDIVKALGYEYSYDAAANLVTITAGAQINQQGR